jgi:dTDP-4-amino-4,6-dideoxygalactose transaminase
MRSEFLPFSPPLIGEEEIAEIVDALKSGWITTGPKARQFEQEFAAFVGAPAALGLNSGTAALHLALVALGIGPGDAVITTPITFCSGVHVIEEVGAKPILADVEPDTLNLDPAKVREALERQDGHRVRAIMPVHLYGQPCDMDVLFEIAREYQLAIVQDAAHSLPAKYKGRMIGSFDSSSPIPVLTAFSFYATKNLTTGEGGMLTGPPELLDDARIWSLHGMSRDAWSRQGAEGSWYYEVVRPGFKYNMPDLQAALGIAQLRKLKEFHARRREIFDRYDRAFADLEELEIPSARPDVEHAYHIYALRLNLEHSRLTRRQFVEELSARNISASVHFIPIHVQPYYRDKYGYRPDDFPVAWREYQRLLSLPLYPRMTDRDVDDVIEAVREIVAAQRKELRHYAAAL